MLTGPWARDFRDRYLEWPVPEMVVVGARFANGRRRAGLSQRRLAELASVSQSAVSRLERGLTPGMSVERLIRIAAAIGLGFPFGFCPHDHLCPYPIDPRGKSYLSLTTEDVGT